MSKIRKILKEKRSKARAIQEPNYSKIYVEEESVYLNINGIPFSIEIVYKGGSYIKSNLGFKFRVNYSPSKITIVNLFATVLPEKLFDFEGTIEIIDCQILDYNGKYIKPDRFNNFKETQLQYQKTNIEDDTLIIRDEPIEVKKQLKTGVQKIRFKPKEEKLDANQLSTIIPSFMELDIFKKESKAPIKFQEKQKAILKKRVVKTKDTFKGKY